MPDERRCEHDLRLENCRVCLRAEADRLRAALWEIAEKPCELARGAECPDYWAVGAAKDACPSCLARAALADRSESHPQDLEDAREQRIVEQHQADRSEDG